MFEDEKERIIQDINEASLNEHLESRDIPEEKERIIFMETYLGELFTSLTKPAHSMPFIYDDIISYIKGEIDFYDIAKEILEEDS